LRRERPGGGDRGGKEEGTIGREREEEERRWREEEWE